MQTPQSIPVGTLTFEVVIPDSPEWFALVFGAISALLRDEYWQQSDGGETIEDTVAAAVEVMWPLSYPEGT